MKCTEHYFNNFLIQGTVLYHEGQGFKSSGRLQLKKITSLILNEHAEQDGRNRTLTNDTPRTSKFSLVDGTRIVLVTQRKDEMIDHAANLTCGA